MEDQAQGSNSPKNGSGGGNGTERAEPVRSRWTPKPEQILILESIFNSGMVNPPKNETVRIRKLLEKFGAVGDANVFYWFQNRRSRSRRRQRQMQAAAAAAAAEQISQAQAAGAIQYDMHHLGSGGGNYSGTMVGGDTCSGYSYGSSNIPYGFHGGSSSSCVAQEGLTVDQFFPQMGFPSEPVENAQFQSGIITVFINGVQTDIPRGPLDMRSVFGEDAILVHSSGLPVPTDEFGSLMHSLEHGESYFLVIINLPSLTIKLI
ncbi:hypothetical protein MLD38_004538 [Melastoma candidum]|uniref:Uncharacterized protein n=1 Tax=Melastoma candidum TaxID=119954 RepID=A0ACB9S610_9MYRT|nr:hypothetical protein MLD38_004538 [Melastoma candidum]